MVVVVVGDEEVHCVTDASGGQRTKLPSSRINDGYCDCIDSADDEPHTSACSGSEEWPSILVNKNGSEGPAPQFICPEQPDVLLPPSRVNDGVCDCCDGADEPAEVCPVDTCAAIRQARQAAQAALQTAYTAGAAARVEAVASFAALQETTNAKVQTLETTQLPELREKQAAAEAVLVTKKQEYAAARIQRLGKTAPFHETLWKGITTASEWIELITAACQVAGETVGQTTTTTCLPLRLAGLDVGISWDPSGKLVDSESSKDVDNLLYYNAVSSDPVYKVADMRDDQKTKKNSHHTKRKLLHVAADEYYEDEDEMYGDDDYTEYDSGSEEVETDEKEDGSKRDDLVGEIRMSTFSVSRIVFMDQAALVLGEIEKLDKKDEEEKEDGEKKEETSDEEAAPIEEETSDEKSTPIDPALIAPVRRELEKRTKSIERGLNYAASAKVLLETISDVGVLRALATGVVFYGSLSSLHVYQVMMSTVEGFSAPDVETCVSSAAALWCPPQSITRGEDKIPSPVLLDAMESFCINEVTPTSDEGSCVADDAGTAIPQTVPDGYFGYYQVTERTDADPLQSLLVTFYEPDSDVTSLKDAAITADEILQSILDDIDSTEKKMKELKDEIGGDDGPAKFGTDGELYSIKDKCFDVTAGKYIYEICMFANAAQKDVDQPKGSGTSLGKWTTATTENKTDQQGREYKERVWKWERGAKCWNGPQRSATAYVTCGAETVVLSADEPDTCRYVLQVSSPIACDEEHRQRHKLM